MARYCGSVCRLCRRENQKLFLKGDRCFSDKCAFERRGYPPGQHGQGRIKFSEYGLQLREKQKVKRIYGLMESEFRLTFERADKMKGIQVITSLVFLRGAWTTYPIDLALRVHEVMLVSWFCTITFLLMVGQ